MQEFRPGQSANDAHRALKNSLTSMEKARRCAVLWFGEILERKLYQKLGYSSINQYAKVELGFSKSRTGDFLSLCRKLERLPKVKEQVAAGRLGYTAARVVVAVADESNEAEWVDMALNTSRRELEREVKAAKREAAEVESGQASLLPAVSSTSLPRPAAVVPVRVSLEMSPGQFARYEALWAEIRQKGGVPSDKVEALLAVMAAFGGESSPRGDLLADAAPVSARPPVQVHVHRCPECEKATVQTSRGELELGAAEVARVECDCQISRDGGRNTTAIPPAVRRRVLARDRHRCQAKGCGHTMYLEVHHKVSRSRGGSNDEENLVTLCGGCHRRVHEGGGKCGEGVVGYWWRDCRIGAGLSMVL